ncbi:FUN14 domain-containing protein 1-like [Pollicipes pollicipes]|uniref:FUN14 domain-containing protein 1-like n=1 Tax=Pollicipes pollicipes TaxID=41117 RepID=UPI0018852981|nr:FUN14 domain-containing protein 1-like [Pollicipes pollicipes]XP_037068058.1 FUN14 domain-containing protein 1-like [Pollicipes pollicipes]
MPSATNGGTGDANIVDLDRAAAEAESLLRRALRDVKQGSTYKQLGVGAAAGWITGYLGMKVGKLAAMTLGGSMLVMQIASHKGYIRVNWKKVNNDLQQISERVQDDVQKTAPGAVGEVKKFANENKYVAAGFTGGFLIGLSCS